MKKAFQYFLLFSIACFVMIILPSQQVTKNTINTVPITDSLPVLSLKDLRDYSTWLRDNISVNAYSKLSPEATLTELWNWKLKQLSDTTKPKK